jgi:hypothetical protein
MEESPMKQVAPFALLGALCVSAAQPADASQALIVGTWKLQSFTREIIASGKRDKPFGERPNGYLSYSPDGRMYGIMTNGDRAKPGGPQPTDQEKTELFGSMLAYAGTYQVDGDKVSHRVDISWNEAWTGTVQVRKAGWMDRKSDLSWFGRRCRDRKGARRAVDRLELGSQALLDRLA